VEEEKILLPFNPMTKQGKEEVFQSKEVFTINLK
jgi:hypothetical protein